MRLLVLGGSGFVGHAAVLDALRRGWQVATFNRGRSPAAHPDVEVILGDRERAADLAPLAAREFDLVFDTWAGAPRAARASGVLLAPRCERYLYVSSGSVYAPPPLVGGDEHAPTWEASADDGGDVAYPVAKRGAELALEAALGERALLARAGLILGPREDVGRLPWWLLRLHRGGEVLAPGPVGRPLQYIDARDLAAWMLTAGELGLGGAFNAISRSGHATMGSLLAAGVAATGSDAQLTWVDAQVVLDARVEPWTELPIWLPPDHEYRAMHETDVEKAHAAGLACRPVEETVSDTWAWLESLDLQPPQRPDRPAPGVSAEKERAALSEWHVLHPC